MSDNYIQYKIINIVTDKECNLKDDYLYPDDTNNMIINKIINYCYPDIVTNTDEIYAYTNNISICFDYDNISEMNNIIKDNKIVNTDSDFNFINDLGLKKLVKLNDKRNILFEQNKISDNTVYFFTLRDLFNYLDIDLMKKPNMIELNSKCGDFTKFYNGLVRKFFPNIRENNIKNYPQYNKSSEKTFIKIKNLVQNNNKIFKLLNDKIFDSSNLLDENKDNFKLIKLSTNFKETNYIKINNLFSDFPLSDKYFLTKLLLEDYEDTYFKLYKNSLKLELSSDDKIITKDLCKKFLKDYKEYIPINIGYLPSFIKYENIFFVKIHTKINSGDIFFSFILHLDGNVDIILNNYNNININNDDINIIISDVNELIDRINNNRIYSSINIPNLKLNDNINLEYLNHELIYSLDSFVDDKDRYTFKKNNIIKFINNFYTHFRLLKERIDLEEDDNIYVHYKRVSEYENMDVFDSVISSLKHPRFDYSQDQIIDIIHENYGISIESAREVFQQWEEKNTLKEEQGKKIYRFASKEPGSEIIIDKYVEKYIRIRIFNISSFQEKERITKIIKFLMKQYQDFVSGKLNKIYNDLFLKVDKVVEKISKIENKIYEPSKIKPKEILEDSEESDEEIVEQEQENKSSSGDELLSSSGDELSSSSGGGSSELEKITINSYFNKKLDSHDSLLFKGKGRACQSSDNKQVIALTDDELERVNKNDILNYLNISVDQKRADSKLSLQQLIKKYKIDKSVVQSYSNIISQPKSDDPSTIIHYICPKYWNIRKDLPVHPRDIYKFVNDIIPPGKKKGKTTQFIFNRTGQQWRNMDDHIFKTKINKILNDHNIDHDKNLESLEWDKFQDSINSLNLSDDIKNEIDLVYREIVSLSETRWIKNPKWNTGKSQLPCCYKSNPNKKKEPKIIKQSQIQEIIISKLTPCNPGRYCYVHPKLQKLFNQSEDIKESNLGGFIINGVTQDNNSLIHCLINIDPNYSLKTISDNILNKRIKIAYSKIGFTKDKIDNILGKPKDIRINYLKLNPYDYIYNILIPHFNDNKFYKMMKIGDGNIIQLFKSDKFSLEDIKLFLIEINHCDENNFENINLLSEFKKIKSEFNKLKPEDKNLIDIFINKINSTNSVQPHIIKLIYDLIISHKNYIDYLKSDDVKDYKYILPLVNDLYDNKNIFIFENVNDTVNLRLQLFKYNSNRKINSFIYKKNNIYEPIFYYNKNLSYPESNLNINMNKDINVNKYIELIINGIDTQIQQIYEQQSSNIFTYEDIVNDHTKYSFFVDNYCKISHIIDGDKIYPILPTSVKKGHNLIYTFTDLPDMSILKNEKIKEYEVKGIIVNNDNNITDIIFNNNTYIPVNNIKYSRRFPYIILGNISINNIDNYLQTKISCDDSSYRFNNNYNYMKYISRLIIQSIIYFIKNKKITNDFYTFENGIFVKDNEYDFKIIPKIINKKKYNFIKEDTDFYNLDESNKFHGKIISTNNGVGNGPLKLNIEFNQSDIINIIIKNKILLNYDKQTELFKKINEIIDENDIFTIFSNKDYIDHTNSIIKNINIYTDKTFSDKCIYDNKINKLIINKKYNRHFNTIKNKIIWNLIDLFIINKDIDIVNDILQNNIDRGDLCKSEKEGEIFFTYTDFIKKDKYTREYLKLNEIFRFKSQYIRDINFYDFDNETPIPTYKSQPLSPSLPKIPNIIKLLFGRNTNIITFLDKFNMDFLSIERGLIQCLGNKSIDFRNIINIVYDKNHLKIGMDVEYSEKGETKSGKITKIDEENSRVVVKSDKSKYVPFQRLEYGKENIVSIDDLHTIVKDNIFTSNNIGFLLITNKNNQNNLKHDLELIYNDTSKPDINTKFILLYHYKKDKIYNLTNIMIDNKTNFMTLEQLYNNDKIKKIIDNDYPTIKLS